MNVEKKRERLPPWFRIRRTTGKKFTEVRTVISSQGLHTVCRSAACPNQRECWSAGTATFMILGPTCTRGCRFCNVPRGIPRAPDRGEPDRVAAAVASLGLTYAVVTSATRDDLSDGGAVMFADTIRAIRHERPGCRVEVLIPDLAGSEVSLKKVLDARPGVLNHNLETVPSLYRRVRPGADYQRSLTLLARASGSGAVTKTGIMVGLGEEIDELRSVMYDIRSTGCAFLTIGQYLRPNRQQLPVERYYHPDEFDMLRDEAFALGFRQVASGPLVRSSYRAESYGAHAECRVRNT